MNYDFMMWDGGRGAGGGRGWMKNVLAFWQNCVTILFPRLIAFATTALLTCGRSFNVVFLN